MTKETKIKTTEEINTQSLKLRTVSDTIRDVQEFINSFAVKMDFFIQQINEAGIKAKPYIENAIANAEELKTGAEILGNELKQNGWCILSQTTYSDYVSLRVNSASGNKTDVDEYMKQLVTHYLDEIEETLCSRFPNRKELIIEAFANHRGKRYASSITLLLTQCDGVCIDVFNVPYFSTERNSSPPVPRTRTVIEDLGLIPGDFTLAILTPLMNRGQIDATTSEFHLYSDNFHRHSILHGNATNFASEINSLKVISLIAFLGDLAAGTFKQAKEEKTSKDS
jgi:hypothetical protein